MKSNIYVTCCNVLAYYTQDLLLSASEDSGSELSETEQLQIMLELQFKRKKKWRKRLKSERKVSSIQHTVMFKSVFILLCLNKQLGRYKYFSAGLVSSKDRYPEHIKQLEEKGLGLRKVCTVFPHS